MEEAINDLIRKEFPGKEVKDNTALSELAHDSFAKIEMLMAIEQSVGVRIPEEDILYMETVGDLIDAVLKLKQ